MKSIVAVDSDTVLAGTQSGKIWVFDAGNHKCQFSQPQLSHALLCLRHYKDQASGINVVLAGLANGQLAVYDADRVKKEDAWPKFYDLCRGKLLEGTSCEDCTMHPVACTAVGKKRLCCGCGSDVVVLKINDNAELEIERRWTVEDRDKGLVLNIAVGSTFVWTSTRDSPIIECWDFSKAKLIGHVDCMAILKESGYTGELRGTRVLSLLLSHKTLWVGLGSGHVILIDPSTRKHLSVIQRHVAAVRCLVDTSSPASSKPTSVVLSGGMGFIERPGCEWKKANNEFGYTLFWEADFVEHAKHLESHLRKRRELAENI